MLKKCVKQITNVLSFFFILYCRQCVAGAVGVHGDSGGGFTIVVEKAHTVYGVLSTKLTNESLPINIRIFTNVMNVGHIAWLRQQYNRFHPGKSILMDTKNNYIIGFRSDQQTALVLIILH